MEEIGLMSTHSTLPLAYSTSHRNCSKFDSALSYGDIEQLNNLEWNC